MRTKECEAKRSFVIHALAEAIAILDTIIIDNASIEYHIVRFNLLRAMKIVKEIDCGCVKNRF